MITDDAVKAVGTLNGVDVAICAVDAQSVRCEVFNHSGRIQ